MDKTNWKAWAEGDPASVREYADGPYPERVAEKWVIDSDEAEGDEWIVVVRAPSGKETRCRVRAETVYRVHIL